jgi:hypothetical protein
MSIQSQLPLNTDKTDDLKLKREPSYLLNWDYVKNQRLKRYLLLQVIRVMNKRSKKYLSIDELSTIVNGDTGVVKEQLKIYIENFIYYGFLDDSYSRGLVLNDKIYQEIEHVDELIREDGGRRLKT